MAVTSHLWYNGLIMNTLRLHQQRPILRRELSRRIGYTNGLHDIYRFSRLANYLHATAPTSPQSLRQLIMEKENIRGSKYADGIIDTGKALGFVHKIGGILVLSDKGYALYAVQRMDTPVASQKALLLNAVLESDGEATLNILDLFAQATQTGSLGPLLVDRLFQILEARRKYLEQAIEQKILRDTVVQDLIESQARLASAINVDGKKARYWSAYREDGRLSAEQKLRRFYDHTITPRTGWLKDLGCIEEHGRRKYQLTSTGNRLLDFFKAEACCIQSTFILPFSPEVNQLLGLPASTESEGIYWRAVSASFGGKTSPANLSDREYFHLISAAYSHVKLPFFNEATIESLYNVIAAHLAPDGQHITQPSFEEHLDAVSDAFPNKLYRLRQRQGAGDYVSLKNEPGVE